MSALVVPFRPPSSLCSSLPWTCRLLWRLRLRRFALMPTPPPANSPAAGRIHNRTTTAMAPFSFSSMKDQQISLSSSFAKFKTAAGTRAAAVAAAGLYSGFFSFFFWPSTPRSLSAAINVVVQEGYALPTSPLPWKTTSWTAAAPEEDALAAFVEDAAATEGADADADALYHMSSTLKKRRAKMNKHKLRKRRKLLRRKNKK